MSATSTTGAAPAAAVAPVVTHIQEPHIELSKLPVFTPTAVETLLEQTGHSGTAYDPAIADLLNNVSAHFISTLMTQAAFLTKHRRSDTVEPRDLQVVLAKYWGNATVPGHSPFRSSLHAAAAERARVLSESAHAVRLATRNGTALGQTAQTHIALSHASALHAARAEAVVRAQPSIREGLADYDQAAAGAAEDAAAAGAGAAGAKGGAGGKGGSKVARPAGAAGMGGVSTARHGLTLTTSGPSPASSAALAPMAATAAGSSGNKKIGLSLSLTKKKEGAK